MYCNPASHLTKISRNCDIMITYVISDGWMRILFVTFLPTTKVSC